MDQTVKPRLSVVVLAWDGLHETRRCVASVRDHTDVPFELIIVDNGSQPDAARFASEASDRAILNPENLGFAPGMNQGLEASQGEFVAFCNNDTVMPPGWASTLIDDFETHADAGIVLPAVTAAGNDCTVRSEPGTAVEVLLPFGEFPSGVLYVMRREVATAVGGWSEEYPIASAEDLDLCFKVWANDLSIVFDQRVLVQHTSQATVATKLDNRRELYRSNLELFMDKWGSVEPAVPRIDSCHADRFRANLARAATAIRWIRRLIATRDELERTRRQVRDLERATDRRTEGSPPQRRSSLRRLTPGPVRRRLRPLLDRLRR